MSPVLEALVPKTLSEYLRDWLIAEGLGRLPRTAGTAPLVPPLWLDPLRGAPAPGETLGDTEEAHPDLTVTLLRMGGIPSTRHEGFVRRPHVQFRVRARKSIFAIGWYRLVYEQLNDERNWNMAGLLVNESMEFRTLSLIEAGVPASFDYVAEYQFTIWDSDAP